ncbi:hypothetical protein HPB50_016630 [Hyalomma asiaticum]|uniref:Uncharacterized protein n=1 Tax=Hyalomma asiaticum TaxID=266040 RepID=A0ACB7TAY1_HYAAI|nr:hypothetical protein HPB50_016630 [Hyalomma asiaticum]
MCIDYFGNFRRKRLQRGLMDIAQLTAVRNQRPTPEPRTPLGTARHRSAALDPASGPNTGTWDLGTSATLDLARLCGPLYRGTHQVSPGRSSRSSRSLGLHCAWPEFCERGSCHRALLSRFSALGGLRYVPWYLLITADFCQRLRLSIIFDALFT